MEHVLPTTSPCMQDWMAICDDVRTSDAVSELIDEVGAEEDSNETVHLYPEQD